MRSRLNKTGYVPPLIRSTAGVRAEIRKMQGGLCGACKARVAAASPWDHHHDSGLPRAVLCGTCNKALGYVENAGDAQAMAWLQEWMPKLRAKGDRIRLLKRYLREWGIDRYEQQARWLVALEINGKRALSDASATRLSSAFTAMGECLLDVSTEGSVTDKGADSTKGQHKAEDKEYGTGCENGAAARIADSALACTG